MGEMSKKHIKYAQDAIHKFIWSNKPAKVKHSTVIGTFDQGGLKSIDMETMNKSLRLAWLARLVDDNDWNNMVGATDMSLPASTPRTTAIYPFVLTHPNISQ